MKKKVILLICALACGAPIHLGAQQTYPITSPLNEYENGRNYFQQKNYPAAQESLKAFIKHNSDADVRQESAYMLACIAYQLKEKGCIDKLRDYLNTYPDSPHANNIYALIASTYYFDGKYNEAIAIYNSCKLYELGNEDCEENTYRLAMSFLNVEQLHSASVWFQTLKANSNKYVDVSTYYLSYIEYTQKRYDRAMPGFLSLQGNKEFGELVPYYIAEIYLIKKNYDKAEIVAEGYLSNYSHSKYLAEMYRILGESQYYMSRYDKAVHSLSNYVDLAKCPKRNALYLLGLSYYQTGVYSQAATMLGEVTTGKDALSQNAYLHLGYAYLQLKEKNKARMAFEQAAATEFNSTVKETALYNYALCIHETAYSPFDESVTVFERFLNEYPSSTYADKVNDYLIEVYMNTKSYEAALKSIAKITHPGRRILEAKQKILFQLGTQSFANSDFAQAIDDFNRSLALGQYNMQTKSDAYYWRGESYFRQNNFAAATRDFLSYTEFTKEKNDEMYALAFYNLGYCAFKQKDYTVAVRRFTDFVALAKGTNQLTIADAYNRIGDGYFFQRDFNGAQQSYAKAASTDPTLGDYAIYQRAFVSGIQKKYDEKISLLNQLVDRYPSSQYMANALYERGRAYVLLGDNNHAITNFRELVNKFPESATARQGANEIGLLYYQNDNYDQAIQAYKQVIKSYPGSDEAKLAQRDLKSIYIDLNLVNEYADFASSLPGSVSFDVNERDSLTYIAAEKIYMKNNLPEAERSFVNYLQSFPDGAFSLNTNYYLGAIAYNQKNYTKALQHFERVLQYPNNRFSEETMSLSAEILFNSKDYLKAMTLYKALKDKATSEPTRQLAKIGVMRGAYLLGDSKETVIAVNNLLETSKLSPELVNEATYYRAKSYLKEKAVKAALTDLVTLSKDTRNLYGAEAKYLVAQLHFELGNTAQAEKEILDYIDQSTPHTYWLARGFILLSDVYRATGNNLDAKQYLLSLQQNYQANDDIQGMIESRLNKLNK